MHRSLQLVLLLLSAVLLFGAALGPAIDTDDDTPDNDIPEVLVVVENHIVPKLDIQTHDLLVAVAPAPTSDYVGLNTEIVFEPSAVLVAPSVTPPHVILRV